MKNPELKTLLQQVLESKEDLDQATVSLLMDVTIHAAQRQGMDLSDVALSFTTMAMYHELMKTIVGIDLSQMSLLDEEQGQFTDALFGTKSTTKPTEEERKKLNDILKDLKIDL